jgi:hypothetical protein
MKKLFKQFKAHPLEMALPDEAPKELRLVEASGFEPLTFRVQNGRSTN